MAPTRWETPNEGDLVNYTFRGAFGKIKDRRGVVQRVLRGGDALEVRLDNATLRYAPDDQDEYGTAEVPPESSPVELYRVSVTVPVSQVRNPGVAEGDRVKVNQGSVAYAVEDVTDGMVTLEDDRKVPVTQITAFDDDVDDYDPFQRLPDWWTDVVGGVD